MQTVEEKIITLEQNLNKVLLLLDTIQEETFDTSIKEITECLKENSEIKKELKNSLPDGKYLEIVKETEEITKLIRDKFDNIINEKKEEMKLVEKELSILNNKKKLANYSR